MKGIYILVIELRRNSKIKIGALGKMDFKKGIYVYIGSAQNNLEKRISRHLSKNKKIKWHIDYLLNNKFVKIKKIFYKKAGKIEECKTAKRLLKKEKSISKFGSSDCKCGSHLFKIKNVKNISELNFKEYKK